MYQNNDDDTRHSWKCHIHGITTIPNQLNIFLMKKSFKRMFQNNANPLKFKHICFFFFFCLSKQGYVRFVFKFLLKMYGKENVFWLK